MITLFGNEEKPKPGLLDRLKESVSKTRSQLSARVEELFTGTKKIDPALLAKLETALLAADIGVRTTRDVLDSVREKIDRQAVSDGEQLKAEIKRQLVAQLSMPPAPSNGATAGSTQPVPPQETPACGPG